MVELFIIRKIKPSGSTVLLDNMVIIDNSSMIYTQRHIYINVYIYTYMHIYSEERILSLCVYIYAYIVRRKDFDLITRI